MKEKNYEKNKKKIHITIEEETVEKISFCEK